MRVRPRPRMRPLQLARNKRLESFFVRNLNKEPDGWAFEDRTFDAVVCCVRCGQAGCGGWVCILRRHGACIDAAVIAGDQSRAAAFRRNALLCPPRVLLPQRAVHAAARARLCRDLPRAQARRRGHLHLLQPHVLPEGDFRVEGRDWLRALQPRPQLLSVRRGKRLLGPCDRPGSCRKPSTLPPTPT
jgi:hypothetical protein